MAAPKKTGSPKNKETAVPPPASAMPDFIQLGQVLLDVSLKAQPLFQQFLEKYDYEKSHMGADPFNLRPAYAEFIGQLLSNPQKMVEMQAQYWTQWADLWQESARKFMGQDGKTLYEPDKGDRRFKASMWHESAFFDFIKQSYLMTSQWLEKVVHETEGLDEETKNKLEFYTRQYINAMAPTNFVLTNPEVLEETLKTRGENLIRGLQNLIEDLERGHGELKISTTDYKAFELGKNIAVTPGKVIYQNDLMQLIQYNATTDTVFRKPLLIVPPWINKFYILDLRPDNSFIKWLVDQGHTVFTVSWVNPDRELAQKRFEDYMEEGLFDAITQIEKATGEKCTNVLGYCLGGTLLTITLAWLHAKGHQERISSATFLTTLVDFEHAGEMKLFMDEEQIKLMDRNMAEQGFLSAEALKKTFSLLRANDLIWSFVINNYLMGREPFPFDLLYWNDDSTNMPAAMHSFYLRKLYQDNLLREPGGVTMNGTPIDVHKIETPCYFLSTKDDHIAPWKATYATTQMIKGPHRFTLAASGHVAGVVNPPDKNKYCYWTSDTTPPDAQEWFKAATQNEGSWWPDYAAWLEKQDNDRVPARIPGGGVLKPLEDAPGTYVKMKAPEG